MSAGRVVIVGGGQSGLAAARAARDRRWEPVILEAGPEPVGSWPAYYDSLRLFSPRGFSGFPGYPFPGPAGDYPARDEVVDYLRGYGAWLGVDIRTNAQVVDVAPTAAGHGAVLADGEVITGDVLVAATGSFANPYIPRLAGAEMFDGRVLHVAEYRNPAAFEGQRVLVVGAGNSAMQVGYELAQTSAVSLVVRDRVRFLPQIIAGRDLHWWLTRARADLLPPPILAQIISGTPIIDTGIYRAALRSGRLDQRRMFTAFTPDGVQWPDGEWETIDAVIFGTGYRPHLPYLADDVLDDDGAPRHHRGLSTERPGLGFLGLEFQRSFASNTLRGVHRDADFVVGALTQTAREAAMT